MILECIGCYAGSGAWGAVVVKALRYYSGCPGIDSRWCHWGLFSAASDNSMCPGSTELLKNEYQDTPGGKGGPCVRLATYHLQVPMSRNLEALTSQNPLGPIGL
jgi:hypothetical protein